MADTKLFINDSSREFKEETGFYFVNPKGVPQTLRSYAFSKDPRFPLLHEGKTKSLNNDIEITPMTNMVSENDTGEWFDDMCMQ